MSSTWENATEAHKYSNNHKPELEKDNRCGCFYCLEIFSPSEIEEWYFYNNPCDHRGTAFCPYCGIDSVIGESSGYPITKEFLTMMHRRWFESGVGLSLTTPFGEVKLIVDGEERPFRYHSIDNDSRLFPDVDGVEQISFKFEPDGKEHTLCLRLTGCDVAGEIEGGECLEALSFYCGKGKITLGCRASFGACEEYDLDYDGNYYPDGIEICVLPNTKTNEYYFGVCWLNKCTGENDVQTWFGADPSSWNIKGKEKNMNEKYGLTPYETREILFYKTDNGDVRVEILLYQENLWLTQAKMAELFEVQKAAISKHLKNIFESGELLEK